MFRKFIKCSLISTMVLASLATPQIVSNAKGGRAVGHQIHSARIVHKDKQLIYQAKRDSNYDFKRKFGSLGFSAKWYNQNRQSLKFKIYRKAYLKNLIRLNNATPHQNRNFTNHEIVKYFNGIVNYVTMPKSTYKLGLYNGLEDNMIKKRYRHNLSFAKGYIRGDLDTNYDSRMNSYNIYQSNNGDLTYKQVGLKRYHEVSAYGHRISKLTYYDALTSKDVKRIFNKSGFDKKYYPEFKFSLTNTPGMSDSKFAKNIVNRYSLKSRVYFPKDYTMGTKWLAGLELGKCNNKATRATAVNFKRYFISKYRGKKELPYQKQFKKRYKIDKIDVIPTDDEQISTVNKYYVYNRNNKKDSNITFIMPYGQYIGQIPNTKGM